jgi:hypothetical protein
MNASNTRFLVRRFPALNDFLVHVQRNYFDGNFPPTMWNVFKRNMDNKSNNIVESKNGHDFPNAFAKTCMLSVRNWHSKCRDVSPKGFGKMEIVSTYLAIWELCLHCSYERLLIVTNDSCRAICGVCVIAQMCIWTEHSTLTLHPMHSSLQYMVNIWIELSYLLVA